MDKELKRKYIKYITELFNFMADNGYTKRPAPRVILNNNPQPDKDDLHKLTGFYDPDSKSVTIFTFQRALKDCLRSTAHEFIHHKQNLEGRLGNGAYNGDKITEDDKLVKLEEEAFLKGNMGFRRYTELRK